jgi:peroxiredoxin
MKKLILVITLFCAGPARAEGGPWIGLRLDEHGGGKFGGARVREVVSGSPGEKAGIHTGEEVLAVGAHVTPSASSVVAEVRRAGVGHAVQVRVADAKGQARTVTVKLEPRPDPEELQRTALVGHEAPDFAPAVQAGAKLPRLSAMKGKVVLLDFFATWCGPCVDSMPHLEELHRKLGPKGLQVVGISTESAPIVAGAAAKFSLSYPLVSDENEGVSSSYRVFALPTMVLIDKRGMVREVSINDPDSIDAAVQKALR